MSSPFLILLLGIAFVVVAILRLRIHAFIALILAAFLVGAITPGLSMVAAVDASVEALGRTVAAIGVVIVAASIVGKCLLDSGAADAITRRLLRWLGVERAPAALLGSGYVLSIPVFFDTVFYLLVPLAKAFGLRTGSHYVFCILAICAGAGLTHSLVAPTPGPLIMASNLDLNLGSTIFAGLLFSILPAVLIGYFWSRRRSDRLNIPLRETADMKLDELAAQSERPDEELPPFWVAILPIVLPVAMIAASAAAEVLATPESALARTFEVIGNRNVAMLAAVAVSVFILIRQSGRSLGRTMSSLEPAVQSAGVIILITSAGGAFGAMLRNTGIGDAIQGQIGGDAPATLLLVIAFLTSAVIKTAQGSSTVAMITASAIMAGIIEGMPLPFHPVYVFLSIGFGGMVFSWMNDSGFWIIGRMSGFTETETLASWSLMYALLGIVGFLQVLAVVWFLPLGFLP